MLVAGRDMSMGHVIEEGDLASREVPNDMVPEDAVRDTTEVIGMTLYCGPIGGRHHPHVEYWHRTRWRWHADERAVAITVNNASGLAGLLRPGDYVGLPL